MNRSDPDAYTCELHTSTTGPASWAKLFESAEAESDYYCTWVWFDNLAACGLQPELKRLWLQMHHRSEGSILGLPLLLQPRSAAALGGPAVTGLSNFYSSLYAPAGKTEALSTGALRRALRELEAQQVPCHVLDLQPLESDGPFITEMTSALRAEGYITYSYFCFGNWHLPVLGRSFAAYEETLPSRIKNTIKRGRKKLDGAGAWTLQVHRTPGAEMERGIEDFQTIYNKSWKSPEPFPHFVPNLCRRAAERGWLRLGVIRFGNTPIAAQLWLVKDGRALIYKLAYDEEYKRFSAGSVLSAELMRRAFDEDRVDDVDYLTGDDGYKRDWMSHRRERVGLLAFKRTSLRGLASAARHVAGLMWRKYRAKPVDPLSGANAKDPTAE
ncbi:GNAT family N-acetyltransferase [Rubrivivax rivuli]|uniref:GNAT family N-acetyltransferase n=1 Tax=Rubrivivax rivuli TaxID=1862385 RepID=UPI0013E3F559|nr:GNAT family N-acetyltransferase [Rubrivivax rivuli]